MRQECNFEEWLTILNPGKEEDAQCVFMRGCHEARYVVFLTLLIYHADSAWFFV